MTTLHSFPSLHPTFFSPLVEEWSIDSERDHIDTDPVDLLTLDLHYFSKQEA